LVIPSTVPNITRERTVRAGRLLAGGIILAVLVAIAGAALEIQWFGTTDAAAALRVQGRVLRDIADMTSRVRTVARAVATDRLVPGNMPVGDDEDRVRALFDAVAAARQRAGSASPLLALTIYDTAGGAQAWAGRPSDLPHDRSSGPASLFVTPSPLGLRLVYVEPILATTREHARLGAVAVEHVLSPSPAASTINTIGGDYVLPGQVVPVSLRTPGAAAARPPDTFVVTGPEGVPLLHASIATADLQQAREHFRRIAIALVVGVLGVTMLLLVGPLLDRRVVARSASRETALSLAIGLVVLASIAVLWTASAIVQRPAWNAPLTLLFVGAGAAALAATAVAGAVRLRLALRTRRRWPDQERALFVIAQLVCGGVLAAMLVGFERWLGATVDPAAVDLRHFTLHPWGGPRLAVLGGILLCHAAVMWAGALACVMALTRWRLPRRLSSWHIAAAILWVGPTVVVAALAAGREWPVAGAAIVLAALACALAALVAPRLVVWYRQTTVASRILALFMAFLLPALLIYPSVHFFRERATRRLIATRYAAEAMAHPQALHNRLNEALAEIDRMTTLPQLVARGTLTEAGTPRTDSALFIWSRTVLARARLTSDVELYDAKGALVSRFALNFPEYTGAPQGPAALSGCRWDVFSEAQLFGAQERNMLHAERNICDGDRIAGAVVVHVVLDYRTLPFISSQSPYFDVFRPTDQASEIEGAPTGDVDFTVYGWGRTAFFSSVKSVWPLDEATFARIYRSREPFWTVLRKGNTSYNVYFSNDRTAIFALGYPRPDIFEHLVRLAELTTLAAAGYVIILIGNTAFTRIARARPATGRALLREIRASFYRKLFLAFVLASIVPVLTLALVIRAYFAGLLVDGIEGDAARTAAVAQRVIEESGALLRRGGEDAGPLSDDVMVWISQVVDQDVNIFIGAELSATNQRDLFASGLLPTRTPEDVYRAIVLDRLPNYISQDVIGSVPYMLAATPIRSGGRAQGVLTVPLALRLQEVEREIDDLDRGVHLAALFFILLGAAIGLSMAERIADPVRQLTRATGRIARGDFDARIAVRSSDELRRLIDAFNSMAAELKAQRSQLERTHRIEAWAEMARQVAHEIKNPITPIQLSAEHLRRVHADRGEPLGAVLEGCVDSILNQVRLLRQIAAEFSSFASAPTARPAPVDPVQLVRDVVEPYRAGLEGRIDLQNHVGPMLPPVLVDRTLVSRALANIVENALHAMPGSGRLLLTSGVEDGFVAIRVEDTGVGMDAEALDRVFEPYFSTKTTGTGLGLPIARRNIELNNGSVSVASEKNRGTIVTIKLPLAA
jgi:signal transduction histidine kinase